MLRIISQGLRPFDPFGDGAEVCEGCGGTRNQSWQVGQQHQECEQCRRTFCENCLKSNTPSHRTLCEQCSYQEHEGLQSNPMLSRPI